MRPVEPRSSKKPTLDRRDRGGRAGWGRIARYGAVLAVLAVMAVTLSACGVAAPSGSTTSASSTNAVDDFNKAEVLRNGGHCNRAIPLYLQVINGNSTYISAYLGLATCYQSQGEINAAIEEYDKAIPIDPRNFNLYYLRGQQEANVGMNGQAALDETTALSLAPPVRNTYQSIAQAFSNFQDFAGAIAAMNKAIALDPNDPTMYEARGGIYLTANQYTAAYNDYKKAIAVAPYKGLQATIDASLADVYNGQSDYDQAFNYMRAAIALEPDNASFYVQSGGIHVNASRFTDALGLYNKALQLVSKGTVAVQALQGKGNAYAALGNTTVAAATYQQALRLTKDPATIATLKGDIKGLSAQS